MDDKVTWSLLERVSQALGCPAADFFTPVDGVFASGTIAEQVQLVAKMFELIQIPEQRELIIRLLMRFTS